MKTITSLINLLKRGLPSRKTYVIVQLVPHVMTVAFGKKWGGKITINNITTYELDHHKISDTGITNPTAIVQMLKQEIVASRIKRGVLIASVPFLHEPTLPSILQMALVLSKTSLPLVHLTYEPVLTNRSKEVDYTALKKAPNMLEKLLPAHYQTAHWWFIGTLTGMSVVASVFFATHRFYTRHQKSLERQFCVINQKTDPCTINDLTKKMQQLENESNTMQASLSLLKQTSQTPAQLDMLITIAQAVPTSLWLENLSLTNTATHKMGAFFTVNITGNTKKPEEISDLINGLSKKYTYNTLKVEKIQQQSTKNTGSPIYIFVVKGDLGSKTS